MKKTSSKAKAKEKENTAAELLAAIEILGKEKNIDREVLLDAIENSLMQACKSHFGRTDNIHVFMNRDTCEYSVKAEKTVVEEVTDPMIEISPEEAKRIDPKLQLGDKAFVEIESKGFGRISTQIAKNVILQKIREEERKVLFEQYAQLEKEVVSGIIQRTGGYNNSISVNIGRCDATLPENEQVAGEVLEPTQKVKVYILDVRDTSKGPRIQVSRSHPNLVIRLFEEQVTEIQDGIVEIKGIAREAGSRTKISVWSNDPNVDAVGACIGVNSARVNAVRRELGGEHIDIIQWDENPSQLIENALNPAKVVAIAADIEEKRAIVIVPDNQLSLAIGQKGQNVRLAHRLTDFAIDIKSLTEAYELGLLDGYTSDEEEEYDEDEYEDGEYEDGEYEDGEYEDDEYKDGEEEPAEAEDADEAEADADADEAEAEGSDED